MTVKIVVFHGEIREPSRTALPLLFYQEHTSGMKKRPESPLLQWTYGALKRPLKQSNNKSE